MRWSAKLGRFAGIDVFVHVTFLALVAYFAAVFWSATGTIAGVLTGVAMILALFFCVLLHEYGHALAARRFGIRTRHITLLPIGGLALLESMPRDPRQEIVVALAGPAVNLAIAAAAYLLGVAGRGIFDPVAGGLTGMGLLSSLVTANLALALFNLLPAFPMDGGRVLRAALSLRMDPVRATRIAAIVGRVIAAVFAAIGLMGNPVLLLIAVFVWIGAGAEARAMAADGRAERLPAARAMVTDFATLAPDASLAAAVDLTNAGRQREFPVLDGARLVGVLGQPALLAGLRDRGPTGRVADALVPALTADAATPLSRVIDALQRHGGGLVCLMQDDRLVGVLDQPAIAEFLRVRAAAAGR